MPRVFGECHLCGTVAPLTREHVPPRRAFNKGSHIQVSADDAWNSGPGETPKGRTQQGGISFSHLCANCNSLLGKWYVPEYLDWVYGVVPLFDQFPAGQRHVLVTVPKTFPSRLVKQVASMFLTINSLSFRHSPLGSALAAFVLDKSATGVPEGIRFYGYLNDEGEFRYVPIMGKYNIVTGTTHLLSEITYPPLGWVMAVNSEPADERLAEIANFGEVPYDTFVTVEIMLHRLPTHYGPVPDDYRELHEFTTRNCPSGHVDP